jgi:predicted RNA binding protein YcfA (HicA-like mRNA interferase family)
MSKGKKRVEALRSSPKGWRYSDLALILEEHGFTCSSKGGGSHRIFKHPSGTRVGLVDGGSGTVLPVYAREVLKAIDALPPDKEKEDDSV